jgi:hypothetical protein
MPHTPEKRLVFAKNLRFLRESLELTQKEYGELFTGKDGKKLKRTNIDSYENAVAMCKPEILEQIAAYHKLPEETLYTKDLTKNPAIPELMNIKEGGEGEGYYTLLLKAKEATIKAQASTITVLENRIAELEQKLKEVA